MSKINTIKEANDFDLTEGILAEDQIKTCDESMPNPVKTKQDYGEEKIEGEPVTADNDLEWFNLSSDVISYLVDKFNLDLSKWDQLDDKEKQDYMNKYKQKGRLGSTKKKAEDANDLHVGDSIWIDNVEYVLDQSLGDLNYFLMAKEDGQGDTKYIGKELTAEELQDLLDSGKAKTASKRTAADIEGIEEGDKVIYLDKNGDQKRGTISLKENDAALISPEGATRPEDEDWITYDKILRLAFKKKAATPEGWEDTVKKMKKNKDISNPWALSWWMKDKGYKPHSSDIEESAYMADAIKEQAAMKEYEYASAPVVGHLFRKAGFGIGDRVDTEAGDGEIVNIEFAGDGSCLYDVKLDDGGQDLFQEGLITKISAKPGTLQVGDHVKNRIGEVGVVRSEELNGMVDVEFENMSGSQTGTDEPVKISDLTKVDIYGQDTSEASVKTAGRVKVNGRWFSTQPDPDGSSYQLFKMDGKTYTLDVEDKVYSDDTGDIDREPIEDISSDFTEASLQHEALSIEYNGKRFPARKVGDMPDGYIAFMDEEGNQLAIAIPDGEEDASPVFNASGDLVGSAMVFAAKKVKADNGPSDDDVRKKLNELYGTTDWDGASTEMQDAVYKALGVTASEDNLKHVDETMSEMFEKDNKQLQAGEVKKDGEVYKTDSGKKIEVFDLLVNGSGYDSFMEFLKDLQSSMGFTDLTDNDKQELKKLFKKWKNFDGGDY